LGREGLEAVLEPAKGNQVQHFTRTGSKNTSLIVLTKSDFIKTILEIVLRQHLELHGVAIPYKFVDTF
jgi:hypothetical protein